MPSSPSLEGLRFRGGSNSNNGTIIKDDGLPDTPPLHNNNNNDDVKEAGAEVSKDEKRKQKIIIRVISGTFLVLGFLTILYMGHIYICGLVALTELLLFRELVGVRYNTYFHIIENNVPLFRTTQWLWFIVAVFYTYSDFISDMIQSNTELHRFNFFVHIHTSASFLLYTSVFVLTIATLQRDHIRFQMNQLTWTIVMLMLTVGQLKYVMHNIFNGLIWFALPVLLVVVNDIMAYFAGMTMGRKFVDRPLIKMSPNKTWEGFIGGWIFTMIFAWFIVRVMAKFTWMVCPTNEFTFWSSSLTCEPDPLFQEAQSIFPTQLFEIIPVNAARMLPGLTEMCSVRGHKDSMPISPCISGAENQVHHHFELVLKGVMPIQLHALVLSLFASLVGPFGGFFASAIKRAYGVKDFNSIIPGHGGVMDRMDCQFLMALFTWVHYNTFVKIDTISIPKMIYMYNLLSDTDKKEFLEAVK